MNWAAPSLRPGWNSTEQRQELSLTGGTRGDLRGGTQGRPHTWGALVHGELSQEGRWGAFTGEHSGEDFTDRTQGKHSLDTGECFYNIKQK